jgi:8-oxo-dGTP pyrophosphatase MutT (NUDIX family)
MGAHPVHNRTDRDLGVQGHKVVRVKTDRSGMVQYGALPWRRTDAGVLEVMLITSRETFRWVIPKGWPMDGLTPAEAAATESYEEAGIRGRTGASRGVYSYSKRLKDLTLRDLTVEVFPLHVENELSFWPEAAARRRRWFSSAAAANAVDEPELAEIIRAFRP